MSAEFVVERQIIPGTGLLALWRIPVDGMQMLFVRPILAIAIPIDVDPDIEGNEVYYLASHGWVPNSDDLNEWSVIAVCGQSDMQRIATFHALDLWRDEQLGSTTNLAPWVDIDDLWVSIHAANSPPDEDNVDMVARVFSNLDKMEALLDEIENDEGREST